MKYDKSKMDKDESEREEFQIENSEQLIPMMTQCRSPFKSSTPLKNPSKRVQKNHLENQIIGDLNLGIGTRSKMQESTSAHE